MQVSAASGSLVAAGTLGFNAWNAENCYAQEGLVERRPSICNGCSNKCGIWVNVKDGRVWTLEGNEKHPFANGTVCARAHGFAQLTYASERLTQPLKKMPSGEFEPISWETAFQEIGSKLAQIVSEHGPESFAFIHDPRPSGSYFTKRFANALGSANVYSHGAACNLSNTSAYIHTIGTQFSADIANAKMLLFIGRSYADGIRPSAVNALANLAQSKKAKIVMVDPRYNNSAKFADEWIPILPGNDIAFILAMCNVLITEDLYDHEFVEQYVHGFEEFRQEVLEFTPQWAEAICGVDAETITRIAHEMAEAAPAAVIEPSWRAAIGCAHKNSFETARAIAAFNALLGSYGQKGGALITTSPATGKPNPEIVPPVPTPEIKRVGSKEYPLANPGMGTNLAVLKAALEGSMQAVFFYNSNAAKGYAQPKVWEEGLSKVDLVVSIEIQMSETALLADYVLPECSYLERLEVPEFLGGKKHNVALRSKVIDVVHPETKPLDEIIAGIAHEYGIGEYFEFTMEELVAAQLEPVGISLDELKEQGVMELEAPKFAYGAPESYKTPTGKIELSSDVVGAAGLNKTITYIERKAKPAADEYYFVGGKQAIHCHTMSTNIESLMDVSKTYHLERLWVSTADAEKIGVSEGDVVEVSSSEHTDTIEVHVTERLRPGVVYVPTHYGGSSPYLSHAYEYGICMPNFVPFDMEPGTGSTMSYETTVKIRKVEV